MTKNTASDDSKGVIFDRNIFIIKSTGGQNCNLYLNAIILSQIIKSSIMLLDNIYTTSITHDDPHLQSSYFYSTGYRCH